MAPKEPSKVIHKDEPPVDCRKHCVDNPKEECCHPSPVELGACHAIGAHLVDPPFVTNLGHLESPVPRVDLPSRYAILWPILAMSIDPTLPWGYQGPRHLPVRGDRSHAVHDSGRCGTLLRVSLDVCVGPPPGAIIDGSHFVSLVNGCHGEGSFDHSHVSFFPEGLFDLSNKLFRRAIVVPAHRGRQEVLSGIFTFEFSLGRPDPRASKSGFRDTQWDSSRG